MNHAAINIHVQVFYMDVYFQFFAVYTRSRIDGLHGNPMINFLGNCQTFSKRTASSYILTKKVYKFQFFHTLANTCYSLFDYSHLGGYEVISHCAFNFHFPIY